MEKDRISKLSSTLDASASQIRNSTVLTVKPGQVSDACKLVTEDGEFYHLTTITGLDEGEAITLFYHFWRGTEFLNIKTSVPKTDASLPSVTGVLPAAVLYEAEISDLLGVAFVGNPLAGKHLLLPDNFPEGAPPPLRKESDPKQLRKMMDLE
jgi:NADH:ubiquinone oxidoreductase subunit C